MQRFTAFVLSLGAFAALQNVASAAVCTGAGTSGNPYICTSTTGLSRNGNTGPVGSSTINTSSVIPAGSNIQSITISTVWSDGAGTDDWALDLAAPGSPNTNNLVFMGFVGSCGASFSGTLVFQDGGTTLAPDCVHTPPNSASSTWGPSADASTINNNEPSCGNSTELCYNIAFSSGSPSTLHYAQTEGTSTLSSQFHGINSSGTWTLYGYVASGEDGSSGGITSWSITIVLATGTSTSTTVSPSLNPVFTTSPNNSETLTATVTPAPSEGSVNFEDNGVTIGSCGSIAVSGAVATCTYNPSPEGTHSISAIYTDLSNNFISSTGNASLQVDAHTTNPTTGVYCNTGSLTDSGVNGQIANQYPSQIIVPISNSVSSVTLTLDGVTSTDLGGIDALLTGPAGTPLILMNNIDGQPAEGVISASGTTFTLSDTGSVFQAGALTNNGSYRPFATTNSAPLGPWPISLSAGGPPTLTNSNAPSVVGTATLSTSFDGVNPNGTWSLFIVGNGKGSGSSVSATGWCLNFTTSAGAATTTSVTELDTTTGVGNGPAFVGDSITYTATVTSGGNPVTTGTVTFEVDGNTAQAATALNGSGVVTYTVSTLAEGTHLIQAFYNGTGSFNVSNGSFSQEVDHHTVVSNGNLTFCNPGGISISGTKGSDTPYPSRVFVANVPGTINTVNVALTNYSVAQQPETLDMVLAGPQPTTPNLVFMSQIAGESNNCDGSENPFTDLNLVFADSGGGLAPKCGAISSGTYKPSAYRTETFLFPAPAPASPNFAATVGSSTFTSQFQGMPANGAWQLFGIQDTTDTTNTGSIGQWCLNFTINPPVFALTKSHTGSFTQGDTADTYTITVTNNGPGATVGTLTLTDTLPTGLTAVSMSQTGHTGGGTGSDWSCTGTTCTRTTVMASGEADTITLTVSVGYNAPVGTNSVTNSASVSGGGISGTQTATDPTTITAGQGYTLTTTVSPNSSGTVTPNPTNSAGLAAGHYAPGAVVTLTANPSASFAFSSWSGSADLSSTSANPTTITMNSAESVTANFTQVYTNITSSVSIQSTGWIYSRISKQGTATVTITNSSGQTISGPIQLVFSGVPGNVTPVNNTGTFQGNPYWTASAGSLAPGASAQVNVVMGFALGTNFTVTYGAYSGNLQ